jgi:hypothetical protein
MLDYNSTVMDDVFLTRGSHRVIPSSYVIGGNTTGAAGIEVSSGTRIESFWIYTVVLMWIIVIKI